ncbi:MAG: DNA repair protein RecO C-terminal domain-containing protein [Clostridium sp.]|nr:DNA repair protein RecO C-terminal domain-containing protein [Clostridium sp.]
MKQKLTFIALRPTRVGDSSVIVNAYSLEQGRIAVISQLPRGARGGARRTALMAMSVVECQGDRRPGREFWEISEPRTLRPMEPVYSNPLKNAVVQFLAELLTLLLRDQPADEPMFCFIDRSVGVLAGSSGTAAANFHLAFLIGLSRHLGIEPDESTWRPGRRFVMPEGVFKDAVGALASRGPVLEAGESAALAVLTRMTYRNMHLYRMTRAERNAALDRVLEYYTLHYASLASLKSLQILRELF